jgi:hypothetical protein
MQDYSETVAVIGRYISENHNGVALHPIDFIDTSTGKLLAEVMDPDITTISPVNKLHPQDDILATGSSRYRPINQYLHKHLYKFSLFTSDVLSVHAGPSLSGNLRTILMMILQKKGPAKRSRNMCTGQARRRKQMASAVIAAMTTRMAVLTERAGKRRRLGSPIPRRERANPKLDDECS